MIQIYADGARTYDSRLEEYDLRGLTIRTGLGKGGTAEIVMPAQHPAYNSYTAYRTIVEIYRDGDLRFRGRAIYPADDNYNNRTIMCEGELCFLQDGVSRPYRHQSTAEIIFRDVVTEYNAQVEPFKQFKVGTVEPLDIITLESTDAESTLDTVNKLTELCGGYIIFTTDSTGARVINWLKTVGSMNQQIIEAGENLFDLSRTGVNTDLVTALVPYGALFGTAGRVTIQDVNGGRDYIQDDDAVARWGTITKTVVWDDVTHPSVLLEKARQYLDEHKLIVTSLTLTALDLSYVDKSIESFKLGDTIRVISQAHGVDEGFQLVELSEDLLNPAQSFINLGKEIRTLTGLDVAGDTKGLRKVQSVKNETAATVQQMVGESVEDIKDELDAEYASKDELNTAKREIETSIAKTVEGLNLSAYAKTSDLSAYAKTSALDSYAKSTDLDSYAKTGDLDAYAKEADINQFYLNHNQRIEYIRTDMQSQLDLKADSATLSTYGETLDAYGNRLSSAEAKIATSVQIDEDGKITSAVNIDADKFTLQSNGFSIKNNAIFTSNIDNKPVWEDPGYTEITGGKVKNYDFWPEENISISHQIVELTAGKLWFTRSWIPDTGILTDSDYVQKSASLGWWADAQGLEQAGVNASYQIPLRLAAERLALGYETSTIGTMYGKAWTIMPTDQVLVRPGQLFYVSSPDVVISSRDKVTIGGSGETLPTVGVYGKEITIGAEDDGDYGNVYLDGFIHVNGIPLDEYILMYTASNK